MFNEETMNIVRLITFMKGLIMGVGWKGYRILYNLKAHCSGEVSDWLEKRKDKIEVFYPLSCSPGLNSDVHLNSSLKGRIHSRGWAQAVKQIESKVGKHMRYLQNNWSKVRKFLSTLVLFTQHN